MFYEYWQNNSGGSFDISEMLDAKVWIEADSADEANEIAESIGIYFNGVVEGMDCSCCGDRWSEVWETDSVKTDENISYGIIHYKNGTIKRFS